MQLKVIQSCQDKVSLGTTSVGSMISPQFGVSEASNESQDLWVPPEELGIHPKGFLDYKPIMCFFHADIYKILSCNMHKLSFKLIIKRGWWICVSHSFHWPTDLDSSPGSRTLTQNRYKKNSIPGTTMYRLQIYRAQKNSLVSLSPLTFVTNWSDHFLSRMLHSSFHSSPKVNKLLLFSGVTDHVLSANTHTLT